jgi:hypothetical protein
VDCLPACLARNDGLPFPRFEGNSLSGQLRPLQAHLGNHASGRSTRC